MENKIVDDKIVENKESFEEKMFTAIVNFVEDLDLVFGTKKITPIALYLRLVTHIKLSDTKSIKKCIDGFRIFFQENKDFIENDKMKDIDVLSRVKYSDRVYLEIGKYIKNSNDETFFAIKSHILTIYGILLKEDQPEKVSQIKNQLSLLEAERSKESEFINEIMNEVKGSVKDSDLQNPMMGITQLLQSGMLPNLITKLGDGISSGELDTHKMMSTLQMTMNKMMESTKDSLKDEKK